MFIWLHGLKWFWRKQVAGVYHEFLEVDSIIIGETALIGASAVQNLYQQSDTWYLFLALRFSIAQVLYLPTLVITQSLAKRREQLPHH